MRYVGAIVGILLILVVTGCAEEEASPASQPTAVAATTSPESTATQPIPSPTRPTATATTVPPTATPKPSQPPAVATAAPASPTSQPTAVTASQPEPVTSTVYVGNTDGDGVFLRRTPNLADRIAAYPDDTQLVVLGPDTSENGITWKHVRTPDGRVGYVPAQYTVAASPTSQPPVIATAAPASPTSQPPTVTAVQPEPEPPTVYVGNTDGDGVFLRRTRNLADRIAAYPDGTQLIVLGPDTSENGINWKHVRASDGKVGYVPAQYTVAAVVAATPAAPLSATPTAPPPGTDRVARPVPTAAGATAAAAQSRGCGPQNLRAFYAGLKQQLSGAFPELVWTQTRVHTEGEARGLAADVILFDRGGRMAGDVDVELSLGDFNRLSPQQQNRSVQLAYAAIHFKVFGSLTNSPHQGLLNWISSAINSVTGPAYQTRTTTSFGCGHEVKVALLPTTRVLFFSATSL